MVFFFFFLINFKRQPSKEVLAVPGLASLQHLHLELGEISTPSMYTDIKSLDFFLPKLEGFSLDICASERDNHLSKAGKTTSSISCFLLHQDSIHFFIPKSSLSKIFTLRGAWTQLTLLPIYFKWNCQKIKKHKMINTSFKLLPGTLLFYDLNLLHPPLGPREARAAQNLHQVVCHRHGQPRPLSAAISFQLIAAPWHRLS